MDRKPKRPIVKPAKKALPRRTGKTTGQVAARLQRIEPLLSEALARAKTLGALAPTNGRTEVYEADAVDQAAMDLDHVLSQLKLVLDDIAKSNASPGPMFMILSSTGGQNERPGRIIYTSC